MYEVCGKAGRNWGSIEERVPIRLLAAVLESYLPLESDIRGFLLNIMVI